MSEPMINIALLYNEDGYVVGVYRAPMSDPLGEVAANIRERIREAEGDDLRFRIELWTVAGRSLGEWFYDAGRLTQI